MATRGIIARSTGGKNWEGVYHHYDSYPEELGKTLWDIYHGHFAKDIDAMLTFLIDDHPAGWQTINDADFGKEPGYRLKYADGQGPRCFCHGERHDPGFLYYQDTGDTPWAYVLDPKAKTMTILTYHNMLDMYFEFATVDLEGHEPDWENLAA